MSAVSPLLSRATATSTRPAHAHEVWWESCVRSFRVPHLRINVRDHAESYCGEISLAAKSTLVVTCVPHSVSTAGKQI